MYCRLKAVSRYETYLNMGLYLPKRLNEVFFSFTAFLKPITGFKFFKILGLQDVNVCKLKDILNNPMLRPIIEWANSTILKGFIRQCPYSAGWVLVENASFVSEEMRMKKCKPFLMDIIDLISNCSTEETTTSVL